MSLQALLCVLGLLSVSGVKTDYSLCGPGTQFMDVKTVDFTSGDSKSSLNMVLIPNADTTVTSGTISGEMYRKTFFGGERLVFERSGDLCEATQCPLVGDEEVIITRSRDRSIPAGEYSAKFTFEGVVEGQNNGTSTELLCVDMNFKVGRRLTATTSTKNLRALEAVKGSAAEQEVVKNVVATCRQSPIDIKPTGFELPAKQGFLDIKYKDALVVSTPTTKTSTDEDSPATTFNTDAEQNPTELITRFNNQDYKLLQYHLHTPSEHLIEGKAFPLEIHFVHQAVNSKEVKTDNIETDEDPTPEGVNEFLVIGMMLDEKPQVEGCDGNKDESETPPLPPASLEAERRRQLLVGPSWTYDKNVEMPAGEKDMGTFRIRVYTTEQQKRLGVDENGNPTGTPASSTTSTLEGMKRIVPPSVLTNPTTLPKNNPTTLPQNNPTEIIPPSIVSIKPLQKSGCELQLKETGILRDNGFTLTNVPFNKFYQYKGSLTTYPFSPDVTWVFLSEAETPLESKATIDSYKATSGTARPTQSNVYSSEVLTFVSN